jgi:hypothetical protein
MMLFQVGAPLSRNSIKKIGREPVPLEIEQGGRFSSASESTAATNAFNLPIERDVGRIPVRFGRNFCVRLRDYRRRAFRRVVTRLSIDGVRCAEREYRQDRTCLDDQLYKTHRFSAEARLAGTIKIIHNASH